MANPSPDYPAAVHTATDIGAFAGSNLGSTNPKHSEVEGKQEAELAAVQGKVGTGSHAPKVGEYLYATSGAATEWRQMVGSVFSGAHWSGADGAASRIFNHNEILPSGAMFFIEGRYQARSIDFTVSNGSRITATGSLWDTDVCGLHY